MKKKILSLFLCTMMVSGALAGCGSDSGSESASSEAVEETSSADTEEAEETAETTETEASDLELNIVANLGNTSSVFTFDPGVYNNGTASYSRGITETLFELNENQTDVEPVLATDIEMVDELTWKITLREGVQFSNGKDLTAEDCKKSLEYEAENNTYIGTMLDLESIEADGLTLTIHTNSPVALMPRILTNGATLIFDTDVMDDLSKEIIGTGAYILESVDGDGNCELVRNENYWRGTPIAARIHAKCGLDAAAQTLALQSGEVEWAGIQTSDIGLFEDSEEYTIYPTDSNGRVYYLYLNENYTFTEDPAVREALQYAFNREAILKGVYNESGSVTNSIFPEDSIFHDDSLAQPDYDVEEAKKILEDAGYTDTDDDGFIEKDGEKVTLNITCYSANNFPTLSEVLQSMLKEIGIDSTIVVSDAIVDDLTAGEFNIATYGYNTLTLGDCFNYMDPVFRSDGMSNFNGFADDEVDGWLDEMKTTVDPEERAELSKKIQEKVYASNDYVYIMHITSYTVVRNGVTTTEPLFGTKKPTGLYLWTISKE